MQIYKKTGPLIFCNICWPILVSSYRDKPETFTTSCACGDTICLHPLQFDNIFVFIRQVASVLACWLFKTSATSWPFDLESGVRVTCDVGYSVPILVFLGLCSRVWPDVRDRQTSDKRQTDRRQTKASLNASACVVGGIIKYGVFEQASHTEQVTYLSQKQDTLFLSMTSANVDQFSKFFQFRTQRWLRNKVIIKDPTTPLTRRYTAL